jgi:hypothetical protein
LVQLLLYWTAKCTLVQFRSVSSVSDKYVLHMTGRQIRKEIVKKEVRKEEK